MKKNRILLAVDLILSAAAILKSAKHVREEGKRKAVDAAAKMDTEKQDNDRNE